MSAERAGPPDSVPTLTEEVAVPAAAPTLAAAGERGDEAVHRAPVAGAAPLAEAPIGSGSSEDRITERILADVQQQVDAVLEYRMREMLAPILTRAADALVRDGRNELTRVLRDVVARAVAQELLRQRSR
jgi:hypothetical protein